MDTKNYFPKYWFVDFKDGQTSYKWSPDNFLVVFITEVDFSLNLNLSQFDDFCLF